MCQVFFKIGPLTIHWYGVMIAFGTLAAMFVMRKLKKIADMNDEQVYDLLLYAMISGVVGARLFYVVQCWEYFKNNPVEIIRVDHGGLVFYGGFIAALLAIYVFAKRQKLSFLKVLDIVAPGTALAHAFGRIGCFLNGCCFGKESKMHWAVVFPQNSDPYKYYGKLVSIHPTQLYESCANLLIFIVLFVLVRKMKKGRTTFLYLILYGTARFIIEFFRGDHKSFILGVLTPAQFIGIFVIAVGAAGFIYFGAGGEKPKKEANK